MMTPQQFMAMLTNKSNSPSEIVAFLRSNFFRCPVHPPMGDEAMVAVYDFRSGGLDILDAAEVSYSPFPVQAHDERSYAFRAAALQVVHYNEVKDRLRELPGLRLDNGGDLTVMISTQLSGCSIVIQPSRDNSPYVMMAHIKPEGMSGIELQDKLEEAVPYFKGEVLPTKIFGMKNYRSGYANIIALLRGGKWTFYAQVYPSNHDHTIVDVMTVDMFA